MVPSGYKEDQIFESQNISHNLRKNRCDTELAYFFQKSLMTLSKLCQQVFSDPYLPAQGQ